MQVQDLRQRGQGHFAQADSRGAEFRIGFRQDVMLGIEAAEFLREFEGVFAQNVRRAVGFGGLHLVGQRQKLEHQCAFFRRAHDRRG